MIIDIILDRKDGWEYSQRDFLDYCIANDFGDYESIAVALMDNNEDKVKQLLCEYIDRNEYNPEIKDYVNTVNWIDEGGVEPVEMKERWYVQWDNYMGTGYVQRLWCRASKTDNELEEQYRRVIFDNKTDADIHLGWRYAD